MSVYKDAHSIKVLLAKNQCNQSILAINAVKIYSSSVLKCRDNVQRLASKNVTLKMLHKREYKALYKRNKYFDMTHDKLLWKLPFIRYMTVFKCFLVINMCNWKIPNLQDQFQTVCSKIKIRFGQCISAELRESKVHWVVRQFQC